MIHAWSIALGTPTKGRKQETCMQQLSCTWPKHRVSTLSVHVTLLIGYLLVQHILSDRFTMNVRWMNDPYHLNSCYWYTHFYCVYLYMPVYIILYIYYIYWLYNNQMSGSYGVKSLHAVCTWMSDSVMCTGSTFLLGAHNRKGSLNRTIRWWQHSWDCHHLQEGRCTRTHTLVSHANTHTQRTCIHICSYRHMYTHARKCAHAHTRMHTQTHT